ncbi:type VI secretion system protein VasD [Paraburkholderia sp. MM5496-R1]
MRRLAIRIGRVVERLSRGVFQADQVLDIDLSAREALNPDDAGRATSVAVRVYQLKDRKMFDGASYDDLLKNDRTVLAQDLQASMASVLNPGASASLSQPMRADTNYVAVVAFYRNPGSGDGWKYVIEKKKLDADKPLKISLMDQFLVSAGRAATIKWAADSIRATEIAR